MIIGWTANPWCTSGMASAVNKLTSEARCPAHPSRRLNSDILWPSAHRGWARGCTVRRARIQKLKKGSGMRNRPMPLRQGVALVLAISGAIAAASSRAADTASQPSLTEIIVTAQKRAQNIQDVPISVIALSAQPLEDGGGSATK